MPPQGTNPSANATWPIKIRMEIPMKNKIDFLLLIAGIVLQYKAKSKKNQGLIRVLNIYRPLQD